MATSEAGENSSCSTTSITYIENEPIPTAPVFSQISSTTSDGYFSVGQSVSIQIQFDQFVLVTGTPKLELETGAIDAIALYTSGTGT